MFRPLGLLLLAALFYGGLILFWNFTHARSLGQRTACVSMVKNIATALQMYATDNQGHYPDTLARLTPGYLKTVPCCPAVWKPYEYACTPKDFTVYCKGDAHQGVYTLPDHPACTSQHGLDAGELPVSNFKRVLDMVTGRSPAHPMDND